MRHYFKKYWCNSKPICRRNFQLLELQSWSVSKFLIVSVARLVQCFASDTRDRWFESSPWQICLSSTVKFYWKVENKRWPFKLLRQHIFIFCFKAFLVFLNFFLWLRRILRTSLERSFIVRTVTMLTTLSSILGWIQTFAN